MTSKNHFVIIGRCRIRDVKGETFMKSKHHFAAAIYETLDGSLTIDKITSLIETPKFEKYGDLSFPCFELAKSFKKSPALIASELSEKISSPFITKSEAVGPYINVFLKREAISERIINEVLNSNDNYGAHTFGKGKTVVIDFSSPNIAKPFSMGHLRSTVIGNALKLITEKCGYEAVAINYIGDWGTQFGKLMVAYKKWGNTDAVKNNPIQELFKLYVHFHEEAKENPELDDEGRKWFKRLEEGDDEAQKLWKWFREESLSEFSRIYDLLGITFDNFNGEAFYNDKMETVINLLEEKNLLIESDGAKVVSLDDANMPPCLIKKSDGATLYATRDLAAAVYRQNTYGFERALYVVGGEQSLHFQQLFSVLKKMQFDWVEGMTHIPFGLFLKDGKKMSTRKGKIVLLNEVIEEAITLAGESIENKNPNLVNKKEVAKAVGVGAIIFQDLKNERTHNIEFSLEDMLKFEGETGPYLQYTYARARSILRKANYSNEKSTIPLVDDASWNVIKLLEDFPQATKKAFEQYEPSLISKYLIDLARSFNKYYGNVRILEQDQQLQARLNLLHAITIVIKEGLRLLGIEAPEEI